MKLRGSLAVFVLAASHSFPQPGFAQPAFAQPRFDVASVKLADETTISGGRGGPGTGDPGRITLGRVDLTLLLTQGYGVQRDQVIGPDARLNGNGSGYSVSATMPRNTTREQFRLMLQELLKERFHLVVHHETRPFPGYELSVAPGGMKVKEVSAHEDSPYPEVIADIARSTPVRNDDKGFPALPPGLPWRFVKPRMGTVGIIRSRFHASTAQLLEILPYVIAESNLEVSGSSPTPRVVDHTGLSGVYDFTLEYVGGVLFPAGSALAQGADPTGGPGGPTLFTALEKQVSLTLKKVKDIQVDMLVVDHADKIPAAN